MALNLTFTEINATKINAVFFKIAFSSSNKVVIFRFKPDSGFATIQGPLLATVEQ